MLYYILYLGFQPRGSRVHPIREHSWGQGPVSAETHTRGQTALAAVRSEQPGVQGIVLCCIALYCIVLCCIALYCVLLYFIVVFCIELYCTVLYCIVSYYVVLYYVVLYCIVLY